MNFNKGQFMLYLEAKAGLSSSCTRTYADGVRQFFHEYSELTKENLTLFIEKNNRNMRRPYLRSAINHYLKYYLSDKKTTEDEKKVWVGFELMKMKRKPNARMGTYLSVEDIYTLINKLKPLFRDFAVLQLMTGARAFEIISLKCENITIDESTNNVTLRIIGKGMKERKTELNSDVAVILNPYIKGRKNGFLFLPEESNALPADEQWHLIDKMRSRYNYNIYTVRGELRFGTHDFRRNFAQLLKQNGSEIFKISKILGHASLETTQKYFNAMDETIRTDVLDLQHKIFKPANNTPVVNDESSNKLSE